MKKQITVNGVKQVVDIQIVKEETIERTSLEWYKTRCQFIIDGVCYEVYETVKGNGNKLPTFNLWYNGMKFPHNQTKLAEYILNNQ